MLIKKTSLYIIGLILLIFGNRKALNQLLKSDEPTITGEDEKTDIHKRFEVQKLEYDEAQGKLINNNPYFEILRIDESDIGKGSSRTRVETATAENASDSL